MKRSDPEFEGLFYGEAGLWSAVLLGILEEIEKPSNPSEYNQARRIVEEPETGCLPFVADALGLAVEELQRKILERLHPKVRRYGNQI
jgi:hypothetical protein